MKIERYLLVDEDGEFEDTPVYEDIHNAWNEQSEELPKILKVSIQEITEIEILYDWKCPACESTTIGLREENEIYCIDCHTWQDSNEKQVWDDLDSSTKRIVQLTVSRLMDEGKSKHEVTKIMKHFISQAKEEEKEGTDAA